MVERRKLPNMAVCGVVLPLLPPKCLHQASTAIAIVVAPLLMLLLMTSLTKLKRYRQLLLCCTAKCRHAHTHTQTEWDDSPSCGVHCCNTMVAAQDGVRACASICNRQSSVTAVCCRTLACVLWCLLALKGKHLPLQSVKSTLKHFERHARYESRYMRYTSVW